MNEKTKDNEKISNIKFQIIAIIGIIIFSIAISPVSLQNDTFYTIKIGEYILQNGIDMKDPFSWHENLNYTYPHWAYDVFTYIIYNVFGLSGIYIVTCTLAVILGLLIYYINKKLVKNNIISFLVTIAGMYLLKDYITARAQLVTFILFIITIYFIEKFLETKKLQYAIGLIIIPIIIANIHSAVWPFYFVLYLPYIGEYIIAIIADVILNGTLKRKILKAEIHILERNNKNRKRLEKLKVKLDTIEGNIHIVQKNRNETKNNPYKIIINRNSNVKWLILIMIICAFTGLLTPIGDTPYTYLIKTMQGNTTKNINEHLPLTIINNIPILTTITLFIAIITFTKAKIRLTDLFMISGLAFLMLYSRRQSSMFILIGVIIFNRLLTSVFKEHYKEDKIKILDKIASDTIGMMLIILMVIGLSAYFYKPKKDDEYINKDDYPVQACDWIIRNLDYKNLKFYNEYNYGSYMLLRGIPVFIDSRADLYAPEFNTLTGKASDGQDIFSDFINMSSIGTYYGDIFKKYQMTHIITYKNSKINMLIGKTNKGNYQELYSDDKFIIYKIVSYE